MQVVCAATSVGRAGSNDPLCSSSRRASGESQTAAPHTHDYGEGAVREQPTCTGQGTMVRVCRICGDVQYDPIAPRGHRDADDNGKCDDCGAVTDSSKSAKTDISNFFASIRDFFVRWFQWLKNLFR